MPVDIFCCCPLSPHRSLSFSVLILQRWKSVHQADCFPAETRLGPKEEGIKGTQPHIPLCFLANVGSLPRHSFTCLQSIQDQLHLLPPSNSTAGFVLSSQTHTALDKCEWTRSLLEISQILQPQTNVLFWEAGLVMLSGRP